MDDELGEKEETMSRIFRLMAEQERCLREVATAGNLENGLRAKRIRELLDQASRENAA